MRRKALLALAALTLAAAITVALEQRLRPPVERTTLYPTMVTDDDGVTSTVTSAPMRIVSLAPQFTETIFVMGVGARLVGVSAGESFPPEATALPNMTSADGLTPDLRSIEQARPDLVLTSGMPSAAWKAQLRNAGIPVVTFNATGVEDALNDIETVGRLVDRANEADAITRKVRGVITRLSKGPDAKRPSVFVLSFSPPLYEADSGGYIEDLVGKAGGKLVAAAGGGGASKVTLGQIRSLAPEICIVPTSSGPPRATFSEEGPCADERSVLSLNDDLLFRPGPRMATALEAIARFLGG